MKFDALQQLIRECLQEVLAEDEAKCAWCGKSLKSGLSLGGSVSHGICQDCKKDMEQQVADMKAGKPPKDTGKPSSIQDFSK